MPSVLVLGARNLGGAILDHLLSAGWTGAAVARSDDTLERVRSRGAIGLQADAADPEALRAAIARARSELDGLDLLVNAVSAARPPSGGSRGFGGGPIADATIEDWRGWGGAVAEQGFAFLSESARALRDQGRGGTIVQVTGGSARRAMPGRGLWSAGAQSVRALVHAAAQELRDDGIHVALLIVDATIESPKTADFTRDAARDSLGDQAEIARAVAYLAGQSRRGWSHELAVTPSGDRWTP
ncbi:MAG TPA: SDR family oxidoreductase [Solirubrobacteraceae bacterium]|nr:SDR family oxidoreductase [Solirubrobacteraceae bacterium]